MNKSIQQQRTKDSEYFPNELLEEYDKDCQELLEEQFNKEKEKEKEFMNLIFHHFEKGYTCDMVTNTISSSLLNTI